VKKIKIILSVFFSLILIFNFSFAQKNDLIQKDTTEAEFPGGINAFSKYIIKNLNLDSLNSNLDGAHNLPGRLYVSFIINEGGMIDEVKLLRNTKNEIEHEVKRVMLNSPKWIPANFKGKPVKSKYVIPITICYK
jgi:periplasmic protein TonB